MNLLIYQCAIFLLCLSSLTTALAAPSAKLKEIAIIPQFFSSVLAQAVDFNKDGKNEIILHNSNSGDCKYGGKGKIEFYQYSAKIFSKLHEIPLDESPCYWTSIEDLGDSDQNGKLEILVLGERVVDMTRFLRLYEAAKENGFPDTLVFSHEIEGPIFGAKFVKLADGTTAIAFVGSWKRNQSGLWLLTQTEPHKFTPTAMIPLDKFDYGQLKVIADTNGNGIPEIVIGGKSKNGDKTNNLFFIECPTATTCTKTLAKTLEHDENLAITSIEDFTERSAKRTLVFSGWSLSNNELYNVHAALTSDLQSTSDLMTAKNNMLYIPRVLRHDYDSDGFDEFFIKSPDSINIYSIIEGKFKEVVRIGGASPGNLLAVTDLDSDGNVEVLVTHESGQTTLYEITK